MGNMKAVYAVNWTEYERGWGQRPDGHTLHLTKEDAKQYIDDYWKRQPKDVPDDYSSPGEPKLVEVDDSTYINVSNIGNVWGHATKWI
jgi:hypothetical protein